MRSKKKGPYVDAKLLEKVMKNKEKGRKDVIKTWARSSVITPDFVGYTFAVHNGRMFLNVYVSEKFASTRTFRGHGAHTERTKEKT